MCLTPKYISNPTLRKIASKDGHQNPKFSPYNDNNVCLLSRHHDGRVSKQTFDNDVKVFQNVYFNGKSIPRFIKVPCGKCYECIKQRINQLIGRIYLELSKHSNFAFFLTLTYNDMCLPIKECVDESSGEFYYVQSVDKKHVQDFLKRLRRKLEYKGYSVKDHLKVFYISEYGFSKTDNKRPHYHLILFFDKVSFEKFYDYCVECWQFGMIEMSKLVDERLRYMCTAHATASRLFPNPKGSDKPFSHWSKGIGLPDNKEIKNSIRNNLCVVCGAGKFPLDRYLKEKLFTEEERNKLFSCDTIEDDDFKRFRRYASKYFPNKAIEDLTFKEVKFIDSQILEDTKAESKNFFKRFVLKRK